MSVEETVAVHGARLDDAERRLDGINGQIGEFAKAINELRVTLARIAVGASLVVFLGNIVVALIVYVLTTR